MKSVIRPQDRIAKVYRDNMKYVISINVNTFLRVEGDLTSVKGGVGDVVGDNDGDEVPPFELLMIGLLEPLLWFILGDMTFDLEEESGDDGDVTLDGLVATAATTSVAPLSSLSSSSELNHISSSSSSWRGSRRNLVVLSRDGTLKNVIILYSFTHYNIT